MKIPKAGTNVPTTFQLAGITWRIVESDAITEMGHCDKEVGIIRLRVGLPTQIKEATFCHELQHAIRYMSGHSDHDEKEVDVQGNLLHQFFQTWK